ncbi:MAG: hypothetical protein PWQ17_659 [Anaerophaga sp.]|nr:hypothetical protein [Anaerophaga sp.]MDK2841154.1 hypothetical protein [Anaerophaga sp.]
MSGIYIHIPFCKTRCYYCDFFKSTKLIFREQYLEKLLEELIDRRHFLGNRKNDLQTIYFGGGTPSLFSEKSIDDILNTISKYYRVDDDAEITLEVNPDDLSPEYLEALRKTGINRLSIGVQSFYDVDLQKMGRRHDAMQSRRSLEWAFQSGFENVGVDLIYGLPWSDGPTFLSNLDVLNNYPVQHLSAYHLTIEPGTQFGKLKRQNRLTEPDDSESENIFWSLHDKAAEMGFEHYEISNFCRNGLYSRHNTAYWDNVPYLGVGPAAHSFDGTKRYWNKSDLHQYIKQGFSAGISGETLNLKDRFNEYLMLRLRTGKGINVDEAKRNFESYWNKIEPDINNWIQKEFLKKSNGYIYGTRKGWFVIDGIIEDLFILE